MTVRKRLAGIGVAAATAVLCGMGGTALAVFPNFSDCPTAGLPAGSVCVDVQSQSGEMVIKGFHVPLDHSLEIRGAIREPERTFVPPTGTNGFFATPVNVPGGLLGIELPIGLNMVTATAELAGPASSILLVPGSAAVSLPLKLHLTNPLLSSSCYIGSNSSPVHANLVIETTNPPPPNRPITGRFGTATFTPPDTLIVTGNIDVDNSFAIPGASGCGGLGLIDLAVDLKLGLPSAAGNNTLVVNNDAGVRIRP
jgi:hypothetical protein